MPEMTWREGGCHCQAVRFRVKWDEERAIECNCSICSMKGYIHVIVAREDFELLHGEELLSTYRFGTRTAAHHFCSTCGITPFYIPRSHPESIDVNARCLDNRETLDIQVTAFDGAHWEENVHRIRGSA